MEKEQIRKELLELQDIPYKEFHSKLMPTVPTEKIIGIRTPILRKYAKELYKKGDFEGFLNDLPHKYYEEDNLHGFLIEQMKDCNQVIGELEKFLPYVDNWCTCDITSPKALKKDLILTEKKAYEWMESNQVYTVRYGIGILMGYFLDENFKIEHIEKVKTLVSEEYYINMMISWYLATALAKQWEMVIPYLERNCFSIWVHNKTIQKAVESYRITKEQKEYLRTLRRKNS